MLVLDTENKGCDIMLIIQALKKEEDIKVEFLRCPICKRGRLCDKPLNESVRVLKDKNPEQEGTSNVIIKCPKCGQKIRMFIK